MMLPCRRRFRPRYPCWAASESATPTGRVSDIEEKCTRRKLSRISRESSVGVRTTNTTMCVLGRLAAAALILLGAVPIVHGMMETSSPLERFGVGGPRNDVGIARMNEKALKALTDAFHKDGEKRVMVMDFPLGPDPEDVADLDVTVFDILTDDAEIVAVNKRGKTKKMKPKVVMVRGRIMGRPTSSLVLGFTKSGANGFVHDKDDGLVIVSSDRGEHTEVYNTERVDVRLTMWEDELLEAPNRTRRMLREVAPKASDQQQRGLQVTQRCYRVAVDTLSDFMSGLDKSTQDKVDYIYTLIGASSILFAGLQDWRNDYYISNNFQMFLQLSYVRVYEDDVRDWYNSGGGCDGCISGSGLLSRARSYWRGSSSPDIPPHHTLITLTKSCGPSGGVAWRDEVCSSYNYAVAGCLEGSFPLPVEELNGDRKGGTWDLVVVAHELGHNYGSEHTHALGTDRCGTRDSNDEYECRIPQGGGTIMSYCHVCSGGMRNIDVRFHEDVIDRISGLRSRESDDCAPTDNVASCAALIDSYLGDFIADECPNFLCEATEDCNSCPEDCGVCPFCGDGTCDADEDCDNCEDDCGECPPVCGDGTCEGDEDCDNCSDDCGACPTCGDGTCDADENCDSCEDDCGECASVCGNGTCDTDEDCVSCSADCGACQTCGDGTCDADENCDSCEDDCGACPTCGDGTCDVDESCDNCEEDCGACPTCGNGTCDTEEDCVSCSADCGACPAVCDDGTCDEDEDCNNCPIDCGECPFCGDGNCDSEEDCISCSLDCGQCQTECGDNICAPGEDCSNCPNDCGTCGPICGDGTCNANEECDTCPDDCGDCPMMPFA